MLKRIGVIVWWFGLLCLGLAVLKLVAGGPLEKTVPYATLWASAWLFCWGVAFIVGESFWRPPK